MATKTTKTRTTPLSQHNSKTCDCYSTLLPEEKRCVYAVFPDGAEFTPDVGNAQRRGEVFTPLWVVQKMITDASVLPKDVVYHNVYEKSEINFIKLHERTVEPAVGTGNFLATILWYKANLAEALSRSDDGVLDVSLYHKNLLTAATTLYAFDISCGNLQIVKHRCLTQENLYSDEVINYWSEESWKRFSASEKKLQSKTVLRKKIKESLEEAVEAHSKQFDREGILNRLYKKTTGIEMPVELEKQLQKVLDSNLQLFNGLSEDASLVGEQLVPGWGSTLWSWWSFEEDRLSRKMISMKSQKLSSAIEKVEKDIEELKKEHFVSDGKDLFGLPSWNWDFVENQKKNNNLEKQLKELRKSLEDNEKLVEKKIVKIY